MLRKLGFTALIVGIGVISTSWGFLGHSTIHQLAVYELPDEMMPVFYPAMESLVSNSTRPDMRRNQDSMEATRHFIDFEMFGEQAATKMPMDWNRAVKKYTRDSLLKYGYLPYHVMYMKDKLTQAFRSGNRDSILFYATDIGHYIADAHVPLHTTVNYDGQLTDQKGIHSLWESMIPELEIGKYDLSSVHKATYLKQPERAIWKALRRAASLVPDMLQKEKEVSKGFTEQEKFRVQIRRGRESKSYTAAFARAYAAALAPSINDQLRNSVDLIADFWYTSWADAGKPDLNAIARGWTAGAKQQLERELKAFRENKLLENKWLLSKRGEGKEEHTN